MCLDMVADGGDISISSVQPQAATLKMGGLFRGVSIHQGKFHGYTIPSIIEKIHSGVLDVEKIFLGDSTS